MPQELLNNDRLTNKLADLELRLGAMESARQPYLGDWYSFNPSFFSYNSSTTINISDVYTQGLLRTGDKIKIIQLGITKYFYVIWANGSLLNVYAGNDYTLTNNPITYFAYSRLSLTLDFPSSFSFTPTLTASGSMTISGGSPAGFVYFTGSTITVGFIVVAATLGGVASGSVYLGLPFGDLINPSSGFLTYNSLTYIANNSISETGIVSTSGRSKLQFTRMSANWTLGANSCYLQGMYSYRAL